MGAVLQSAAERDGANWRSAYINVNRSSRAAPGDNNHRNPIFGARARSSAAPSLSTNPPGIGVSSAAGPAPVLSRPAANTPRARLSRKKHAPRIFLPAAAAATEPRATASTGSASTSYSAAAAAAGAAVSGASGAPYGFVQLRGTGGVVQRERSSNGGGGGTGGRPAATGAAVRTAGSRFDEGDSDLEPLDVMSGFHEIGTTHSEWDDVLAAVSLPHQAGDDGMRRAESPDGGQQ